MRCLLLVLLAALSASAMEVAFNDRFSAAVRVAPNQSVTFCSHLGRFLRTKLVALPEYGYAVELGVSVTAWPDHGFVNHLLQAPLLAAQHPHACFDVMHSYREPATLYIVTSCMPSSLLSGWDVTDLAWGVAPSFGFDTELDDE
jgi:hypothetical protein